MKSVKIGRSPDKNNTIVIDNRKVGREHAELIQVAENKYIIKDLGSTNGTFVDGRRTRQAEVNEQTKLQFADFSVDPKLLISKLNSDDYNVPINYSEFAEREKIILEFEKLEQVYEKYIADKRKIERKGGLKKTGLRAGLALIPYVGSAIGMMAGGALDIRKELEELNENFKKEYVCPKCYKFFGAEHFENIQKRGYCFYCKTKFRL